MVIYIQNEETMTWFSHVKQIDEERSVKRVEKKFWDIPGRLGMINRIKCLSNVWWYTAARLVLSPVYLIIPTSQGTSKSPLT